MGIRSPGVWPSSVARAPRPWPAELRRRAPQSKSVSGEYARTRARRPCHRRWGTPDRKGVALDCGGFTPPPGIPGDVKTVQDQARLGHDDDAARDHAGRLGRVLFTRDDDFLRVAAA